MLGDSPEIKNSKVTTSVLLNYILCLSIMKSIVLKFKKQKLSDEEMDIEIGSQLEYIK